MAVEGGPAEADFDKIGVELARGIKSLAEVVDGVARDFTVSYLFGQHRRGRGLADLRDYLATRDDRLLTELASFGGWLAAEASNAKGKNAG